MKKHSFSALFVTLCILGSACSSSKPKSEATESAKINELKKGATLPFPFKNLASDQEMALKAYTNGETCPGGAKVGSTARDLQFVLPTLDEVEESMKTHECDKHIDVLKGLDGKPYTTKRGNTIPLWVWMCGDGTVVRVKPFGDPTSKFNRKPHGSVALRYPCDAKYETFDDEMFKFDANGNPIPKWARDLDSKDPDTIETWAHAAHFPVIVTGKIKR